MQNNVNGAYLDTDGAPPENVIIRVRGLVKDYGEVKAVRGLSFDVMRGEIFGILGPNGAGKTTTLEIIETLRAKTAGKVWVCGYDVDTEAIHIKRRIGVQLQAAGYYPGLNLEELLKMFGGLYNVSVDVAKLLGHVGLLDKRRAKYKALSGGQKQRFSIATTLIHRPEVVFLDEPTTGLDPQARRNLWELIREVRDGGATVVLTTHYMDEAEVLCDRVGIVSAGQLVQLDTPQGLIESLLATGFEPERVVQRATLEDVFLSLTGTALAEGE